MYIYIYIFGSMWDTMGYPIVTNVIKCYIYHPVSIIFQQALVFPTIPALFF